MSRKSRNEIRHNYITHHPNYVFYEDNSKYRSIGITHHPYYKVKNSGVFKNMPLDENPEYGKSDKSYIRYGIISAKKKNYGKVLNDYKFSDSDFKKIKSKIRNYKNKIRKQKKYK